MLDGPERRLDDVRRYGRRKRRRARLWLEHTRTVTHLSVVVLVPLLIAVVTLLSNSIEQVSFLLYPPLASGTYTLFADPEGPYASPMRFVGGMTVGALCGWAALAGSARLLYHVEPTAFQVQPGAAALGIFLTAVVTWAADLELPTAFSTALLVLVTGTSQLAYVVGVMLSSTLVAAAFAVWRDRFYERRARYLYGTTDADDHVLVPMRGETAPETAMLAARLAAAHEAGKVVLLDTVGEAALADAERAVAAEGDGDQDGVGDAAAARAAAEAASPLEETADRIEATLGLPCEVVVARADGAETALRTARETGCDLVVTPYETADAGLSPYVRDLFRSDVDVVAFRSVTGRSDWRDVLVPVRRAGEVAHAMIDYAGRLAGEDGTVSVCTCIDEEAERRRAEARLADLVETAPVRCETRVARSDVGAFLRRNAGHYDLVLLGASTDRSTASRFLSPPTFRRVADLETDVGVVHRG